MTGSRGHVLQINDPIEETFPYKGRVEFEELEDKLTIGAQVTHVTPTLTQSQTFSEDGTYVTEAVRGGILAISRGQTEAAYALGLRAGVDLRAVGGNLRFQATADDGRSCVLDVRDEGDPARWFVVKVYD